MSVKKRKKEEGELRLTDKKHPPMGILSTIIACLSFCMFVVVCVMSGNHGGKAGMYAGVVGIICLIMSICGFIIAWISLHQEDIRAVFPTIGSVANGILTIFYMLLYVIGTF